jgi:outer membrane receptor protein involved in Fe transport
MLRSYHAWWRGEGSLTGARLRGNIPGVAGFGTTGSRFSAGPFVRPNEAINSYGFLPDALELEGKVWLTARLPFSLQGGLLFTHILGERFTPSFEILGRYVYYDLTGSQLPDELFRQVLGQSIFVEPRGDRQYQSRDLVDAHLEWRTPKRAVVTFDLFNVFGADALTSLNTNIGDQEPSDPTSVFGAARLRVPPRTLRIGMRVD